MKKLFATLIAAVALLGPAAAGAQTVRTQSKFEGERITGIDASSAFKVVLIKSLQSRVVVDVNDIIEPHLRVTLNSDGVVSVDLSDPGPRWWREFNRIPSKDRVMKVTVYTSTINTIRLTGATELTTADAFTGENIDIQVTGASSIKGLSLSGSRVKLQASGASRASMVLSGTSDLVVIASGASNVDIAAAGVAFSKVGASGASTVRMKGDGTGGDWNAGGASNIRGDEFAVRDLTATAGGASNIRCNVSGTLSTHTGGASSIRYGGNPTRINNTDHAVRPL